MSAAKAYWQVDTERLAQDLRAVAAAAGNEEDFKQRAEPLLQRAFRAVGADVESRQYELRTYLTAKRADVVYGHLILEYKAPGRLGAARSRAAVVEQLQGYLTEEAARHGDGREAVLEKMVGVALDGESIAFVRYSRRAQYLPTPVPIDVDQSELFPHEAPTHGFQVQGPFLLDRRSLASLLVYVRSTARQPLYAENLAKVFGPGTEVARIAVAELFAAVMRGQRRSAYPRVNAFYDEWERIFGAVYGEKLEKAEHAAEETAAAYHIAAGGRLKPILFAVHTYYALLMKLIAHELLALQRGFEVRSFVGGAVARDDEALREAFVHLESGSDFGAMGIVNFLEADFFSWYLDTWTQRLAGAAREMLRALADFEPATPVLEPEWTRDLLQKLYELIVPRALRHSLGEYYTPDWLAGYVVERSGYGGGAARFLDPSCGSGTFLVQAIRRAADAAGEPSKQLMAEVGQAILDNVVGFDLNPLAVLAARTNYLIAFAKFLPYVRPISIPVYLCDSVVPPERKVETERQGNIFDDDTVIFHAGRHDYVFPLSIRSKELIDLFCSQVVLALASGLRVEAFARLLTRELARRSVALPALDLDRLTEVYRHIKQLNDENRDGIWAHYIKNAFAPAYVGEFDYVVGNPPWVRWGYLSEEYRARTLPLWHAYGLFSLKGHQTRLGAGEKDFSMLFTYACADRYLKRGGTLAFVITGEVFKSKGAGEGFRRFRIGTNGAPLKALWMEDLVHLQPFQAANKTTLFALRKGEPTGYPVPVTEWRRKKGVGRIAPESKLAEVMEATERRTLQAVPVDAQAEASSWQTASRAELKGFRALKGNNPYHAIRGASTEPYGVFWLNVEQVRPDGMLVVENQHDRGKREIKRTRQAIEPTLVYPAVAGGDLQRYGIRRFFYALISQDPAKRAPYPEEWMEDNVPLTLGYLKQFQGVLLSRGSNVVREFAEKTAFYAMYGIGTYTFAPHRVVWKRMAQRMEATVLGKVATPFGRKEVISTDTTSFMVASSRGEAHYLCAVLNSDLVNDFIASFSSGGRGFGAPSIMQNLAIPRFDARKAVHSRLAALSREAHGRVGRGQPLEDLDAEVNAAVRKLWTIAS